MKYYSLWCLAILLVAVKIGYTQISGTYTINSQVATGGTNFSNFYDAVQALSTKGINGDLTINVVSGSGPYNEQVRISKIPGADKLKKVTINGNGETLAYASHLSNARHVLFLDSVQFLSINQLNIIVQNNATYGWALHLNETKYVEIMNCGIVCPMTSTRDYFIGIQAGASLTKASQGTSLQHTTINGNTIVGGFYGIHIRGNSTRSSDSVMIANNVIEDFYVNGIYLNRVENSWVDKNIIHRPNRATVNNTNMVYLYRDVINTRVTNNIMKHANGGSMDKKKNVTGIYVYNCDALPGNENYVVNNIFTASESAGKIYGINCYSSDGLFILHNTIDIPESDFKSQDIRGIIINSVNENLHVVNNLIHIQQSNANLTYGYHISSLNNVNLELDYNNISLPESSDKPKFYGVYGKLGYLTLLDWKNNPIHNFDHHSVSFDAMIERNSLLPIPTAHALNNKGKFISVVATDFTGLTRNAVTPDIGALEFEPPDYDLSVGKIMQKNSSCAGKIALEATVYNNGSFNADSAILHWSINQGPVVSKSFHVSLSPSTQASLLFDSVSVAGLSSIKLWVSIPNAVDRIPSNDTSITEELFSGISGSYTIDQKSPLSSTNYHSFDSLFQYLEENGICGPMNIDVVKGSGPYYESFTIPKIKGSSATNTITVNGNQELLMGGGYKEKRAMIQFKSASYVTLENLSIQVADTAKYGWIIQFSDNSSYNTILNCTFISPFDSTTNSNYIGIAYSDNDKSLLYGTSSGHNTIKGNTFIRGYSGVIIRGIQFDGYYSVGNVIEDNSFTDVLYTGVELKYTKNSVVAYNDISRANVTKTYAGFVGLEISQYNSNCKIYSNKIHNPCGGIRTYANRKIGIRLFNVKPEKGQDNLIYNNLIYNMNGNGETYGIVLSETENVTFVHNTISLDLEDSVKSDHVGIVFENNVRQNNFYNNIISVIRPKNNGSSNIFTFTEHPDSMSFDNNAYYMPNQGTGNLSFARIDTAKVSTFSDWQKLGLNFDSVSVFANPKFPDPIQGLLQPINDSIGNIGMPLTQIQTDIYKNSRDPMHPDPGAIEFDSNDVVLVDIIQNTTNGYCLNDSIPLILEVLNNSSDVISNIAVEVTISDSSNSVTIKDTIKENLQSGQLYKYHLEDDKQSPAWMSKDGQYLIVGAIYFNKDTRRQNDSLSIEINAKLTPSKWTDDTTVVCKLEAIEHVFPTPKNGKNHWYYTLIDTAAFHVGDSLELLAGTSKDTVYYSRIISANGCVSDFTRLDVDIMGEVKPSFTFSNDGLKVKFDNSSVIENNSWRVQASWDFGDGDTSNLSSPEHTYGNNGKYVVTLSMDNGCDTKTVTQTVDLSTVGIAKKTSYHMSLFPNPNDGNFYIELQEPKKGSAQLLIYNLKGQLMEEQLLDFSSSGPLEIQTNLSRGMYLISIIGGNEVLNEKISVQ